MIRLHHQLTETGCRSGSCSCRSGYVEWKWECQPEVGLGEDCITSAQCTATNSQFCNPINHKCSCERGFSPMVSKNYGLHCQQVATKVLSSLRRSEYPGTFWNFKHIFGLKCILVNCYKSVDI